MRRRQAPQGFGAGQAFRWRGGEISRPELWVWHDHYRFFRRYGLVSIAIVEVGGPDAALWSGMTYMLIAPLQMLNGRVMGGRIRQASTASPPP
jgi:hypothetical protein